MADYTIDIQISDDQEAVFARLNEVSNPNPKERPPLTEFITSLIGDAVGEKATVYVKQDKESALSALRNVALLPQDIENLKLLAAARG